MKHSGKFASFLSGLFFTLFWHVSSWLCSLPAWITLLLHFAVGLPLYWFWLTLGAWLLVGLMRYLLLLFSRWGAREPENLPPKENKNPYSATGDFLDQK